MKKIIYMLLTFSMLLCPCALASSPTSTLVPAASTELPKITVNGSTDLPGNFFLSFSFSRNLIMLDGQGNIVWSKHEAQPTADIHTGFWDFKKHKIDGKTYYSYHDQTGAYDDYGLPGYAPGERVILDENFNEIKRITFEQSAVTKKGALLDGHDFLMLDLNHYILSGYLKDTVYNHPQYPNGSSVVYSYLQEVKDGKVIWDWKSIDYPELYDLTVTDASTTANDFANKETDVPDYVHFNAMRLDEKGNLVCSFRHLSTILCLDRSQQQHQILWKLSGRDDGFGLTENQKTSCQHYVTVDNNNVTAFDNSNKTGATRIVSYQLSPDHKTLKSFREYAVGNKFSLACGSAQKIANEVYAIGWGWSTKDAQCLSVYDFSQGKSLMTVTLDNANDITYRCVYYE